VINAGHFSQTRGSAQRPNLQATLEESQIDGKGRKKIKKDGDGAVHWYKAD